MTSSPKRFSSYGDGSIASAKIRCRGCLALPETSSAPSDAAMTAACDWTKAQAGYRANVDPIDAAPPEDTRALSTLARLSERDREALTLIAWDDLTPAQAAAVLGMPANRFRVRLHRASRRLQSALETEPLSEGPASHPEPSSKGASV